MELLHTGEFQDRARTLGGQLRTDRDRLLGKGVVAARVIGLWAGIDIDPALATGRECV